MRFLTTLALALSLALPAAAQTERLKVATTFTVIADMARNVAGDAADVESITKPGAEIHYYQRPDPVERSEPRALVRAVLPQPGRDPAGRRLRRHRAAGHQPGALYRQAEPAWLDGAPTLMVHLPGS